MSTSLPPLTFAASYGSQSRQASTLRREARRGVLVRVHPGAYVEAADWSHLDPRQRHVLTVRAVMAGIGPDAVVSHSSAVAMHALPSVAWPRGAVHVIDPRRSRMQVTERVVRHPGPVALADVVEIDGLRVTSEHRTVLDVARSASFADGVLCMDAVLRREASRRGCFSVSRRPAIEEYLERRTHVEAVAARARDDLLDRISRAPGARGLVSARRIVEFASPWSENGGESLCRVALLELGAPEPLLQVEFFDGQGLVGRCDFLLGRRVLEFDGKIKYDDAAMRGGRAPSAVVRAEKARERRLLRTGAVTCVGRCDADDVALRSPLADTLRDLGVVLRPRRDARMWAQRHE